MLVWLLLCNGCAGPTSTATADTPTDPGTCRPAELFATDNVADGLFEAQADLTISHNGATVTGSTLLDGVFWSDELQQTINERAREFHLCSADGPTLHTVAEAVRSQFNQQAVLTFEYLPPDAPQHGPANAVTITVPDIDFARFRDAFAADSVAHHRLLGGSVTITDHALILVAGTEDLDVARRLVGAAGGCWSAATIAYGKREFVQT
ncbi:hypothetical protein MB901379_01014 [Mycobacterium basiliense]|uniref:Uncharacterized protein n=1 Tax=Mycobacterium basiliense TaxID=2094119 RepID=A0A447GAK7_9MYCO|nr:hypothetical protein MB901379_01014 [Mycobacterium basiliense]